MIDTPMTNAQYNAYCNYYRLTHHCNPLRLNESIDKFFKDEYSSHPLAANNWDDGKLSVHNSVIVDNESLIKTIATIPHYNPVHPTNYFNGSILEYDGKYWLAYRTDNKNEHGKWCQETCIVTVQVSPDNFQPLANAKHTPLALPTTLRNINTFEVAGNTGGYVNLPVDTMFTEDPRLWVAADGRPHVMYTDGYKMYDACLSHRLDSVRSWHEFKWDMQIAEFYSIDKERREKNWTPFTMCGRDYIIYGVHPGGEHIVLCLDAKNPGEVLPGIKCASFPKHILSGLLYDHNKGIRGGTPAIEYDENHMICFYHAVGEYEKKYYGGPLDMLVRKYTMGAYIFEKSTFNVVQVVDDILKPDIYPPNIDKPCGNFVHVIFPAGVIAEPSGAGWFVSYGYNDFETRVTFITRELFDPNFKLDLEPFKVTQSDSIEVLCDIPVLAPTVDEVLDAPVWVISVEGHDDRLMQTKTMLRKSGYNDIRHFKAIDGTNEEECQAAEKILKLSKRHHALNGGVRGCSLSHLLLAKQLLDSGEDFIHVVEDDIMMRDDFKSKLTLAMELVEKHCEPNQNIKQLLFGASKDGRSKHVESIGHLELARGFEFCAGDYILWREGARLLLENARTWHEGYHCADIQNDNAFGSDIWCVFYNEKSHNTLNRTEYALCPQSDICRAMVRVCKVEHIVKHCEKLEGWCPKPKMRRLAQLANDCKTIFEVGVYGGQSLAAVALGAEGPCQVIGCDPYTADDSCEGWDDGNVNKEWWGDLDHNRIKEKAEAAVKELNSMVKNGVHVKLHICRGDQMADMVGNCDLIHIDGNHAEEVALADVKRWIPKINKGGTLVFDDIDWPETKRAQDWLKANKWELIEDHIKWGVYRKQ